MSPNEKNLHRAAERVLKAFVDRKILVPKKPPSEVVKQICDALRADFQEETAIHREAERILEANKRQATGMDQRTLLLKIKEKLARERGFVL